MNKASLPSAETTATDSQFTVEDWPVSEAAFVVNLPQPPIKLLLVENNMRDAYLIRKTLIKAGTQQFNLIHMRCLEPALTYLNQTSVDVILLDLPPDRRGINIVTKVRSANPQVPLIVLTGCHNTALPIEALRHGAQYYILKSQLERHSLVRTICYSIERHQMQMRLKRQIELGSIVNAISQRIRQSLQLEFPLSTKLEEILTTAVAEVRQALLVDRVFIYRYKSDWSGSVVVESVDTTWPSVLGKVNQDYSFWERYDPVYKQGRIQATENINTAALTQSHLDFLAEYQIRANLVVPIVLGEKMWGLLVANQCSGPRPWQSLEISLLQQLATQAAIAIQQSELYEQFQSEIAERKRVEQQLRYNAFHDVLTDLPNRELFIDRLGQALKRFKQLSTGQLAVLFLDIDRFKLVNDALSHRIGDQLLIAIAQRLIASVRPIDTVACLGGDEFAILLEDIKDPIAAVQVAERIFQALSTPFYLEGHDVTSTASIGIALSTTGYDVPETLLRDADIAMHRAKAQGKARYVIFDTAMHAQSMTRFQIETHLRKAVERQEFQICYQPIISLKSRRISGFEALVRWQHPIRGMISPIDFIPVAEETGLIIPIGSWVLRKACAQMQAWQHQFKIIRPLNINVNLSPRQFSQPDLVEEINQALQESHLEPQQLTLEITESVIMEKPDLATLILEKLRESGIKISMDDFGTGYSSLSYLYRFPIDTIKIDRSFIKSIDVDGEKLALVSAIIQLAWTIGMDVVAEGIETAKQVSQLKVMHCEYGQGYFFSQPLNSEAATALLAEEQRQKYGK